MNEYMLGSMPIIILPPLSKQARIHKKKRINKKWAKRYGFITYSNGLEDGKTFVFNNKIHMNHATYLNLRKFVGE